MGLKKELFVILIIILFLSDGMIIVSSVNSDSNPSNNVMNIQIDVIDTKTLTVDFVPIDYDSSDILSYKFNANISGNFIKSIYPLAGDEVNVRIVNDIFDSSEKFPNLTANSNEICGLMNDLFKSRRLLGYFGLQDRVVGMVPSGWFAERGDFNSVGVSCGLYNPKEYRAVIVEEGLRVVAAHEMGHTYGLCDEYFEISWSEQNGNLTEITGEGCPNGDLDSDGQIDESCFAGMNGCATSTLDSIFLLSEPDFSPITQDGEVNLYNMMGGSTQDKWIDNLTYNHLLKKFSTDWTFLDVAKSIVISGSIYKNGTVIFDKFYVLNETEILNVTETEGDYELLLKINDSKFYSTKMDPDFHVYSIDGETYSTDVSYFAFVVPFNDSITQIVLQNATTILTERNVSENGPVVLFTTSFEGQSYDDDFVIDWSGNDSDGDNLTYTIFLSDDGGNNFTTLVFDTNETSTMIENSFLENGSNFRVKVLATDGVKTGSDISNFSFSIETDPFVELISPEDKTLLQNGSISFIYKTHTLSEANLTGCSLFINNQLNATNSTSVIENSFMNFSQNLADGDYTWGVECTDSDGFIGESELRTFSIGHVTPEIISLTALPSPQEFNKNVTIEAELNDPFQIDTVILNITSPNSTEYEFILTNTTSSTWAINFTDNINGSYVFKLQANYSTGEIVEESGEFEMVEEILNIRSCSNLDVENSIYTLSTDVYSDGTCFKILANNITLEGNGHTVIYSGASQGNGIRVDGYNKTKIQNLTLRSDNTLTDSPGIFLSNSQDHQIKESNLIIKGLNNSDAGNHAIMLKNVGNSFINNNSIITSNQKGYGVYIEATFGESSNNNSVVGNSIVTIKNLGQGIYINGINGGDAEDSRIVDNTIQTYGSSSHGLFVQSTVTSSTNNNIVQNNNILTSGTNSYGLRLLSSSNNALLNLNISSSKENEVEVTGLNNTFLNVSYSDEVIEGQIIRKWYLNVGVNNTSGNMENVNISGFNITNNLQFSELTASNGEIETQELIEYINNAGAKTYYTNYTINVSKEDYENASQSVNLTTNLNLVFTLESIVLPNDTNKFYVKDSSNNAVAWLGDSGNVVLKGSCFSGGSCDSPGSGGNFIIKNSASQNVAFINSTGDLCVESGDCSDLSGSCNPGTGAFIIRNSGGTNVSYIDYNGDLCLTGGLYENSEL